MKRRLFVAIPVPEDIKLELRYALHRIGDEILSCGRLIPEDNWHITFKFFGEKNEEDIPKITSAMKAFVKENQKELKNLAIEKITFDNHRSPRILWAEGTKTSSSALGTLRNLFDAYCALYGIKEAKNRSVGHEFVMHISLMRFFKYPPRDAYIHESFCSEFPIVSFDLMESKLRRGGSIYSRIKQIQYL